MGSNYKVGVIGAGIVGLSTALEFQKRFPNSDITILADKFDVDTTSDGAAGLFEPSPSFMGPNLETTREWIKFSYDHYSALLTQDCGINVLSGYILAKYEKKCSENHFLKPVLPVYKPLSEDELSEIGPGDWRYGTYVSTLVIPNRKFLPWCAQKFQQAGGKIVQRHIDMFSDLGTQFHIVFNCTGLGAAKLCNDGQVVPIRGQIIQIECSSIKEFYMMSEQGSYIIPAHYHNVVTLGGTQDFGHYNLDVDEYNRQSILARTSVVRPEILTAKVNRHWVGLRPYRHHVRVEVDEENKQIIHNYGHGGYGVTSAPGSAHLAVSIFADLHRSTTAK